MRKAFLHYAVHSGYVPVNVRTMMFLPAVTQAENQLLLSLYVVSRNIILF
jgi:hypothetical protein